jgi:O-succinylbenzoate synthase
MKLEGVELRRVRMPLIVPFVSAHGREADRDILLIRACTTDAQGWGECVALSQPTYSSEYVDAAQHVITNHLLPRLLVDARDGQLDAARAAAAMGGVKGHPMAKAAVELALLDAELQEKGISLAAHLGGVREAVDSGVSIGITRGVDDLLELVDGYVAVGYRRVKLKIEPGWDIEPVRIARERIGDRVSLQVDANGSYRLADAEHLAALDPFDLLCLEQPLADEDLLGHATLARRLRTPVCLDESITSAHAAEVAIALGACRVVNIKAGRVGGYLEARRIHDVCVAAGVAVWCGGMLETGVGRAANAALASLPGFTLPGDLSASDRYYGRDLTTPFVLDQGRIRVPTGPGIGVSPLDDVLEQVTTSVDYVRVDA